MRKYVLIGISLIAALTMHAQVWMTDVLEPKDKNNASTYKSTIDLEDGLEMCHLYNVKSAIWMGGNYNAAPKYIVYDLEGKYDKLSFWVGGNYCSGCSQKDISVLRIQGDGNTLYDEPVRYYDAPNFIVVDVKGVHTLKMDLVVFNSNIAMGYVQLWKEGETVVAPELPFMPPKRKVKLVDEVLPYYNPGSITTIRKPIEKQPYYHNLWQIALMDSFSMGWNEYYSGLQLHSHEGLLSSSSADAYFWLNKQYEKISFIVGPNNNRSSKASAWLVIYGEKKKILYEGIVRQTDLPRQVVVDVSGQNQICFSIELRDCDLLGGITFACVDIFAYPEEALAELPEEGIINPSKERLAKLPSPCSLMKNIKPISLRGTGDATAVRFTGESKYITFSMGGEKFTEGFIMTTGSTFLGDHIDSYFLFDLAEEFDYISFYLGMLTKRRTLDDDRIQIYADDSLILDTLVHCFWPNQYFEIPINKCRTLKFVKGGHGTNRDCYVCVADIALYRGKPVKHNLFVHNRPECPDEADLIDLCGSPYFHYVGRYLSTLTDFDFNDCFHPGGTQRQYFQMKDGSKIYKGVMLEANMPLGLESVTITDAALMFLVGAGSAISASDFSAFTGVSAGGGLAGGIAAVSLMNNRSGGQASVVSFNPFGEYKSCTFTIANKSEYWDDMDMLLSLGERVDHPFKLNIFADHRLVGELWLTNKMEPVTMTVPIFNCNALTFWLEPGDTRSGQFVLYDMKVSKAPCDIPVPDGYHTEPQVPEPQKSMLDQAGDMLNKALDKVNEEVENVNEILTPTDSIVTSPEGRPGEVVETGGALPPPVWVE